MILRKASSFIKRDLWITVSYRFSLLFGVASIFFSLLTFFFIAKLFGKAAIPYLEGYGGDYFSFVLIGIAFSTYLGVGLGSFAGTIRSAQVMGTLEAMLVTPTRLESIVFFSSLGRFTSASFRVLAYLALGWLVFGVSMGKANLPAALLILILTILCFSSLGIISASFIMIFKRGDPINWVISSFSTLFGGVFFPITVLPSYLEGISHLLPITYSLRAVRHALLQGYSLSSLGSDILVLAIFCVVLLPLSMYAFKLAVRRAKKDGSLTHY